MYNKNSLLEKFFVTEINKLISVYGSISCFGKKLDEIAELVSSNNSLEFDLKKTP